MNTTMLAIEPKKIADGRYSAAVVDLSDDAILHVTDSYPAATDAVKAAQKWIEEHD